MLGAAAIAVTPTMARATCSTTWRVFIPCIFERIWCSEMYLKFCACCHTSPDRSKVSGELYLDPVRAPPTL